MAQATTRKKLKAQIESMEKKRKRKTETIRPWKDLPTDLLEPIAKQLGTIDFIMFGCVCKSWRSLACAWKQEFMASRPPLVLLFPNRRSFLLTCYLQEVMNSNKLYKTTLPFSISNLSILGLFRGFLIFQNDADQSLKPQLWIMNLFTRHCLCFPHPKRHLFNIIVGSCSKNPSDLVLIGYCSAYSLHFCRSSDPKWTVYEQNNRSSIKGMTIINKKLYVLFGRSDVCVFEDLRLKRLPIKNMLRDSRLLVTDDKNRLLIVSNDYYYYYDKNEIYSLNWSEMMWEKVATREDTLLFKHRLRRTSFFWSLERTESVMRYCRPEPEVNLDRCLSIRPCKYLVQKGIQTISVNYKGDGLWCFPHLSMGSVDAIDY